MTNSLLSRLRDSALLLAIGLAGALAGVWTGVPMPYLTGSLAAVGAFSAIRAARGIPELTFPGPPRKLFVGLIGTMIGASFTLELMRNVLGIWPSLIAMVGFVGAALGLGYALFRLAGGYDPVTSIYSAMPGGLIEAVALGEAAGADVRALTLQHFARVVLVVVAVPFLYLLWSGEAVGSAGGQSFQAGEWDVWDLGALFALAVAGMWLGPRFRVPAAHLVGPLLLSAALHGSGLLHLSSPAWLLFVAQLVVGTGLGTSFAGARPRDLGRALGLSVLYVGAVLALGYGVAAGLMRVTAFDFDTLFVSFAPGGVTEMGLVALSLGISPVIVTAHHVFRIGLTVALAAFIARRIPGRSRA